jgi:hypothetical protein
MRTAIDAGILIEDLIERYPGAVGFLIEHGLPCVVCGEPFWGSLAELARDKGWDDAKIDELVQEFNEQHTG